MDLVQKTQFGYDGSGALTSITDALNAPRLNVVPASLSRRSPGEGGCSRHSYPLE